MRHPKNWGDSCLKGAASGPTDSEIRNPKSAIENYSTFIIFRVCTPQGVVNS